MAQILVRGLDESMVERLKERAKANNRSLEGEVRTILEDAATALERRRRFRKEIEAWQKEVNPEGRTFSDSVEILRELRRED